MIKITKIARDVLEILYNPELREKASEHARNHGLLNGVTEDSLALAQLMKDEGITETFQEFFAQALIGFVNYASTHYYIGNPTISMLDNFIRNKRIIWSSYK